MTVKGMIQNEECLALALYEGREFIINCEDSKDANSKRVSLYNARRKLSLLDQKKIKIHKERIGENWVVRVYKGKQEIMEVIDGKLVPYEEVIEIAAPHRKQLIEMLHADYEEEEIIAALIVKGYNEVSIKAELKRLSI